MGKKKQKMAENMKTTEERIKERAFYVKKIKALERTLAPEKFDDLNATELREKCQRLQQLHQNFEASCLVLSSTSAVDTTDEDEEIDAMVEALKSKIACRINTLDVLLCSDTVEATEENGNENQPEAPIEIEDTWGTFDGRMHDWHRFSKRFKASVHQNEALEADRKLDLLKKACAQSAAYIISEAGDDYNSAWSRLNDMFGEAYGQIHHCMQKISRYSRLQEASSESLKRLRNFANIGVDMLKQVMDMEQFESVVTVMLAEKLDAETARIWERHRMTLAESWANAENNKATAEQADGQNSAGNTSDAPKNKVTAAMHLLKWEDFAKFLQTEIDMCFKTEKRLSTPSTGNTPVAGRSVQANSHNEQAAQAQSSEGAVGYTPPSSGLGCPICSENHVLHKCDVYKSMSFPEKHRLVEASNLCKKCLRRHHGPTPCENKTCNRKCPECEKWGGVAVWHNATLCPTRFGTEAPRSSEVPDWQQS